MHFLNLTGKRFGYWKVIKLISVNPVTLWLCRCKCKTIKIVAQSNLGRRSKSCGCYRKERSSEVQTITLTGQQFGFWKVLRRDMIQRKKDNSTYRWICRCICGRDKSVASISLNNGDSKSCGCSLQGGFNYNKRAILYYVRVSNPDGLPAYKIGITNISVRDRFKEEGKKVIFIAEWDYQTGSEAIAKEREILQDYQQYRYYGPNLLYRGNTELFICDILKLDKHYANFN